MFLISMLTMYFADPASASCDKKNRLINSMVSRLADFASSNDDMQKERDGRVIRQAAFAIIDEDCLNANPDVGRLANLAASIAVDLDAPQDYGNMDYDIFVLPIQIKVRFSQRSDDTADCRCYARQEAASKIFFDISDLVSHYSQVPMTNREVRAVSAWLEILNDYLDQAFGIRIDTNGDLPSLLRLRGGKWSSNIEYAYERVGSNLQKHCGLAIAGKDSYPGGCKFRNNPFGPSPIPISTPDSTPTI